MCVCVCVHVCRGGGVDREHAACFLAGQNSQVRMFV